MSDPSRVEHHVADAVDVDVDDDVEVDDDDGLASPASGAPRRPRAKTAGAARWTRWLHVYTSMISLLIVLFFGVTGLTLNHPTWSLGGGPSTAVESGTLPAGFASGGNVDFLAVTEYVRSTNGVRGSVADYRASETDGTVSFKGPGYAADLIFDVGDGTYQVTVVEQGLLGVLNDLHKGRDTARGWNWLIDVAAVFLVVVALTGLGIQLFQRKRRRRALTIASAFTLASLIAIALTTR